MSLAQISQDLAEKGYAALLSSQLKPVAEFPQALAAFVAAWDRLEQDRFMADGGTYRYRRYSRFLLSPHSQNPEPIQGTSIFQDLHDNPLNGGVVRTFAPLEEETLHNPFLQNLILFDAAAVNLPRDQSWQVGVHLVRILARPGRPGQSSPEGVHIDAERYTVQHLVGRQNVKGGVFSSYSADKLPVFHWLQLQSWDTIFFTGSTWHSASPIEQRESDQEGHRDILLIDFSEVAN